MFGQRECSILRCLDTQRPTKSFIEVVKENAQTVGVREDDGLDGSGSDESEAPIVVKDRWNFNGDQ